MSGVTRTGVVLAADPSRRVGAAVRTRPRPHARRPVAGVRGARPDPGAARGRGGRHAAPGARPLRGPAPGPAGAAAGALRVDRAPGARRRGPDRATPRPDRRLVHPRVRGRGGGPVQPVGGRAPRPDRPRAGAVPVRAEPARGRRGTPVLGRVPHRRGRVPARTCGWTIPVRRSRPAASCRPATTATCSPRCWPPRTSTGRAPRSSSPACRPGSTTSSWRPRWSPWPRSG